MTIRDMFPITGGCHFFHGCDKWQEDCSDCPQIPSTCTDYPSKILKAKRKYYNFENLTIVTLSKHTKKIIEKTPFFNTCRLEVIPNSIETDVFRPYDKKIVRKKLGLPLDRKIIGYVPSFSSSVKGYKEMLEALDIIEYNNLLSTKPFIMLVGNETPATSKIKLDKKNIGYIADNKKLAEAYSAADIIVVPSLEETFSNTAAEAISCGVPVVGFKTGAIPELAIDGKTGYTYEVGDVKGMADGIIKVLTGDDLSDNCRKHAVSYCGFMKQAEGYESLFFDLMMKQDKRTKYKDPKVYEFFGELGTDMFNMTLEQHSS